MRLLLDTHALLWMLQRSTRLSPTATELLGDPAHEKLVSAVSAYEICLKYALGKLPGGAALALAFEEEIAGVELTPLPVTIAHAREAGLLDMSHKDPFDRLLIAQARVERIAIVSDDRVFDAFGIERIW